MSTFQTDFKTILSTHTSKSRNLSLRGCIGEGVLEEPLTITMAGQEYSTK